MCLVLCVEALRCKIVSIEVNGSVQEAPLLPSGLCLFAELWADIVLSSPPVSTEQVANKFWRRDLEHESKQINKRKTKEQDDRYTVITFDSYFNQKPDHFPFQFLLFNSVLIAFLFG